MFHLVVASTETTDPVVPVRWCLEPEAADWLRKRAATNVHILFSISNGGVEVDRQLAPLEQAMEYLEFRHPGVNTVSAAIVWGRKPKSFRQALLAKPFAYEVYLDEADVPRISSLTGVSDYLPHQASIQVNVPAEFFAHEPPEWEKEWVNALYESPPRDQCAYRKRRLVAYTVQPIIVGLYFALMPVLSTVTRGLFILISLLLGRRGVKLEPLFHPFRDYLSDVWERPDGFRTSDAVDEYFHKWNAFFVTDSRGDRRPFGFWLLHPLHWVIAALIIWSAYHWPHLSEVIGALAVLVGMAASVGIVLILGAEAWRWAWLRDKAYIEPEPIPDKKQYEEKLSDILCGPGEMRPQLASLRRPSVTLRFKALKARVCRPYLVRA